MGVETRQKLQRLLTRVGATGKGELLDRRDNLRAGIPARLFVVDDEDTNRGASRVTRDPSPIRRRIFSHRCFDDAQAAALADEPDRPLVVSDGIQFLGHLAYVDVCLPRYRSCGASISVLLPTFDEE